MELDKVWENGKMHFSQFLIHFHGRQEKNERKFRFIRTLSIL